MIAVCYIGRNAGIFGHGVCANGISMMVMPSIAKQTSKANMRCAFVAMGVVEVASGPDVESTVRLFSLPGNDAGLRGVFLQRKVQRVRLRER